MTSTANRVWTFATVILMIVIVALGWFLGVAPRVAEATRAEADRVLVAAQNQATSITLEQLRQDADRLSELEAELLALQTEFPELPEYDDAVEDYLLGLLDDDLELESLAVTEPAPADSLIIADDKGQVPEGTLLSLDATLVVLGDWQNALDLVARIQSAERFTLVTRFSFAEEDEVRRTAITITVFMISGPPAEGALPLGGVPIVEEEPAEAEGEEGE